MPSNRFPDSPEKRELRRQDARHLANFCAEAKFSLGLTYCGMPSVEFLDIRQWLPCLRSIHAVELDSDVLTDMEIQWNTLNLQLPVQFIGPTDIHDYLQNTPDCFDVYNLDLYGGFYFKRAGSVPKSVDTIRQLVAKHGKARRSFILVCTFNARDTGVRDYLDFLDEIPDAIGGGWRDVAKCCDVHKKSQASKLKLCFPYFCWQTGVAHGFEVLCHDVYVYYSTSTMIHFCVEFHYRSLGLPDLRHSYALVELANRPLFRLAGVLPTIDMSPPQITAISVKA
jgi:hypothetical protein